MKYLMKYLLIGIFFSILFISGIAYADITDGLVAYYPFEGNANDESGNGNDGKAYGTVTYVPGVAGFAASFDNETDYIKVPDDNSLHFETGDFSISCFVNVRNVPEHPEWPYGSSGRIASKRYFDPNPPNQWSLGYLYENRIEFWTFDSDGESAIEATDLHLNTTYHVAAIRKGQEMSIYIDGVLAKREIHPVRNVTTTHPMDLYIGVDGRGMIVSDRGHFLDGTIDELRFYNRALNKSEILAVNREVPSFTSGPYSFIAINQLMR